MKTEITSYKMSEQYGIIHHHDNWIDGEIFTKKGIVTVQADYEMHYFRFDFVWEERHYIKTHFYVKDLREWTDHRLRIHAYNFVKEITAIGDIIWG